MADEASRDGKGHRARLRARLFEGGPDALLDHELVEYLLGLAIPRRDTKPLAKRLLKEFGGIGRLLSADAKRIAKVGDISESAAATLEDRPCRGEPDARGEGQGTARARLMAGFARLSARRHGA